MTDLLTVTDLTVSYGAGAPAVNRVEEAELVEDETATEKAEAGKK